jgi:P27 family predicted phage terminase small subunit
MSGREPTIEQLQAEIDTLEGDSTPAGPPPPPPEHLDPVAASKWVEIVANGEIDNLDLLQLYCTEWARWRHAESEVTKIGEVVKSPSGYPQPNPWLSISRQAFDRLVKLSKRLGLSDPR